jgi:MFS family permease
MELLGMGQQHMGHHRRAGLTVGAPGGILDVTGDAPPSAQDTEPVSGHGWYVLAVLTAVYVFNIADRYVVSTLIEPIKADLQLTDTAIGFLTGTALAIFYTGMGIPLGMIADRVDRRKLIAVSIGIWSLMTSACGLANTFGQLLVARFGVGTGEAGGTPASQSILADIFPLSKRVLATSIFTLGAALGSMLGSVVGGNIAEAFGWRAAFFALGIPGLALAFLVRYSVYEPIRGGARSVGASPPPLSETLRFIASQRSLLHILAGATVVTYWGWGLLWWTPAFLARSHHMSTGEAGTLTGTITGLAGAIGIIAGGALIHRLARNDARWQVWVVAIATFFGTLASILVYATTSRSVAVLALWVFVPVAYLNLAPILSLTQTLVVPRMRGLSCGILLFGANIANLALAPQLIGIMSDVFHAHFGAGTESLRWALLITTVTGFWATYHFWAAARSIRADMHRIESLSVKGFATALE